MHKLWNITYMFWTCVAFINTALLSEHVNQKLFMAKMVCNRSPALTDDEANALRYAAGYVPFSLQKKLCHRPEFSEG